MVVVVVATLVRGKFANIARVLNMFEGGGGYGQQPAYGGQGGFAGGQPGYAQGGYGGYQGEHHFTCAFPFLM
jgi:hypothetical protein